MRSRRIRRLRLIVPRGRAPTRGCIDTVRCSGTSAKHRGAENKPIPVAFLLFQEPVGSEPFVVPPGVPEHGAALEERRSWNPIEFADRYGLKLVAANYFLVRSAEEDTAE